MSGPLTDGMILDRLGRAEHDRYRLRIDPFVPEQLKRVREPFDFIGQPVFREPAVGYGLSSMGYDIRLGTKFRFLKRLEPLGDRVGGPPRWHKVLDPLDPSVKDCYDPPLDQPPAERPRPFSIEPGACVLGESVEWFRIPEDCTTLLLCKSTWARCFIDLNTTPLEPGWQGTVTVEIVNHATLPVMLRPGEGIGQVVFFSAGRLCNVPYNQRPGASYQDQRGPTGPRPLPPQPVAHDPPPLL